MKFTSLFFKSDVRPNFRFAFDITVLLCLSILFSFGKLICSIEPAEDFALVVNSVQNPTLFFPGSNRLGNLLGLFSSFFNNVTQNYHSQIILHLSFAFIWPYLAFCFFLKRHSRLPAALFYHILVLSQFSESFRIYLYVTTAHPTNMAVFFLCLGILVTKNYLAAEKPKRFALVPIFFLTLLSCWIDPSAWVYLIFSIGIFKFLQYSKNQKYFVPQTPPLREIYAFCVSLIAFIAAVLQSKIYAKLYPGFVRSFSSSNYAEFAFSVDGIMKSFKGILNWGGGNALLIELALSVVVLLLWHLISQKKQWQPPLDQITKPAALIFGGLFFLVLFSQVKHMAANDYHPRYFALLPIASVLFVTTLSILLITNFIEQCFHSQKRWPKLFSSPAIILLLLVIFINRALSLFGIPASSCDFKPPSSVFVEYGEKGVSGKYFAFLGSYWDIWPATFHAWQKADEKKGSFKVYPTGYRSELMNPQMINEANTQLLTNGQIKLLCIGKRGKKTEFGELDCKKLVDWNRNWGVLPKIGTVSVLPPLKGEINMSEVVIKMQSINIGETIEFTNSSKGSIRLAGWYGPEEKGTWTKGEDAQTAFTLECNKANNILIKVNISHWYGQFTSNLTPLKTRVFFNNTFVGSWKQEANQPVISPSFLISKDRINCNQVNRLDFKLDAPGSPVTDGLNNTDQRKLGLLIEAISLKKP